MRCSLAVHEAARVDVSHPVGDLVHAVQRGLERHNPLHRLRAPQFALCSQHLLQGPSVAELTKENELAGVGREALKLHTRWVWTTSAVDTRARRITPESCEYRVREWTPHAEEATYPQDVGVFEREPN